MIDRLKTQTKLDLPPELLLEAALQAGMTHVVIVGYDGEGKEYFASSQSDAAETLWHLERARHQLMQIVDRREL